jgi:cytochrome P450
MVLKLTSHAFLNDPYAVYAQLRASEPIIPVEQPIFGKALMLTRYEDVVAVLKDTRFSNERHKATGGRDWTQSWWVPGAFRALLNSMALMDDPHHARLRNLVHKGFTPRMIQQMESQIEKVSHTLLDQAAKKQTADLMTDFALPLPLTIISEMMGVPLEDRRRVQQLMKKFLMVGSSTNPVTLLPQLPNFFALNRFFHDMIALRQRDPQDDLITTLIQAEEQGDTLSEQELVAMLFLLLLAGHETTVNLIGSGTLALLEHPDQLQRLSSDLSLLDGAIEEMLRFTNPVQQVAPRYALEDLDLYGRRIPKGSTVMAGIASANRDETVFKDADTFDITRNPNRHVAFGLGIHYCLGAPLARLEAKVAFTVLLTRFPNAKLAISPEKIQWRRNATLRGLKSLPLQFND